MGLHTGIELIELICEIAFSQEEKNHSS
jgi:hypothetical protein